jgi:15-cis-phytoene synthase
LQDGLVTAAHAAIAQGSKSFALASRLFDARTRDRAALLYAWCRHCDDVIDGQVLGHGEVASDVPVGERLAELRRLTDAALRGEATGEMPFDALGRVAAETGLPARYCHDLLDGFAMDAAGQRYETAEQTLTYCYHVAGCVGVMMAIVMGVDPKDRATLDRACDLGLSFQLNNMARDVEADTQLGRCYLPAEWLGGGEVAAVRRMVDLAERYEASARCGTPMLSLRSAWAVLAAARIYGDIGRKVRALGGDAWKRRVTTSTAGKLAAVAAAWPQAVGRKRLYRVPVSRDGLWTMAR